MSFSSSSGSAGSAADTRPALRRPAAARRARAGARLRAARPAARRAVRRPRREDPCAAAAGLRDIQRALQVTTILVTHDQDEAFELADRIGVIDRGRLLEVGTARISIRARKPFSSPLSSAPGPCSTAAREGGGPIRSADTAHPDDLPHEEGGPVRVLIRPEQVVLDPRISEPAADVVPVLGTGEVVEQTFAGSLRRVRVRVPEAPGLRHSSPSCRTGKPES